jgi:hypothetical protein
VGESGRERAKWALLQFSYSTLLSEWYMDWMDGIGVVLFWSRVGESRVQMRTNERYDETRWGGVFCLVLSCLVLSCRYYPWLPSNGTFFSFCYQQDGLSAKCLSVLGRTSESNE